MLEVTIGSSEASAWDWSAVSAVTGIASLIGIGVALASYLYTIRGTERAHLHSTFRVYLDARLAHLRDPKPGALAALIALKLYTLEEMLAWLERARRLPLRSISESSADGWHNSIAWHIRDDRTETLASLRANANCYSDRLLKFAGVQLAAPELGEWVDAGRLKKQLPLKAKRKAEA